jgi:hypothetical protein
MPKLRNGKTDIGQFTQWLGRKCRNHNPLSELSLAEGKRVAMPRLYEAKSMGKVQIVKGSEAASGSGVLLYEAANRLFEITIREVEPEQYLNADMEAVGH